MRRSVCALIVVGGLVGGHLSHGQGADTFAAASAEFAAGNFHEALRLFEQARAAGLDTPALLYNIGVAQYRTGGYASAEASFRDLGERFPRMAGVAAYNRGLSLLALGRAVEAEEAFATAGRVGDERIARLAADALTRMSSGASATSAPARRWIGYVDFGLGHDDNVALVDELTLPATASASSTYAEVLGYASRPFEAYVPLRLTLSGYAVRYADTPEFDQELLRAEALFDVRRGEWRLTAGPHLWHTTLDGDGFERGLGGALRALRPIGARLWLDARLWVDHIDSPSERFDYVDGRRERWRLGVEHSAGPSTRLRAYYEHERQRREDPSVSPERDRILVSYGRNLTPSWSLDGSYSYRESRYQGTNPRKERLREIVVSARRELTAGWDLNAEYRLADNDTDIARYSYESNRVAVTFSRSF